MMSLKSLRRARQYTWLWCVSGVKVAYVAIKPRADQRNLVRFQHFFEYVNE